MNISLLEKDIEVKPIRNNENHYLVSKEVLSVEVAQFLRLLPENHELGFHDQFYTGSVSDPGAFISIKRKEDTFVYMLGNHGWSSKWATQSIEFITAYILINAKSRRFDESPFILTVRKGFRA